MMRTQSQAKPAIAGIIPARYGSTRFPGKPLVDIMGKTLIQRTYENALSCPLLDRLIVATDDIRIFNHVKDFGGEAAMTPEECPTGSDRLAYVVSQDPSLQAAEMIINIQGDEPCLPRDSIEILVKTLRANPQAVVSTLASRIETLSEAESRHVVKCVIDTKGRALYFSRALIPAGLEESFDQGCCHYKHIGLYAFRPNFLLDYAKLPMTPLQTAENLEQLKILEHGYQIAVGIAATSSVDVNIPADLKKVEQRLCTQNTSSSQAGCAPR